METKSDLHQSKPNRESTPQLNKYQQFCSKLMLDANNVAVPDRAVANMIIGDFKPSFDGKDLDLTLSTIKALNPNHRADRDFYKAIENLLSRSESELERAYQEGDEKTKEKIREIYAQTIDFTPQDYLGPTLRFYQRHSEEDLDQLVPESLGSKIELLYKGMVHPKQDYDDNTNENYFNWAKSIFENSHSVLNRKFALRAIITAARLRKLPDSYMDKIIEAFGLDSTNTRKVWSETHPHDIGLQDELIVKNISAMKSLETKYPGMCKILHEDFGIIDFARYPLQTLIAQYVNRNRDVPYGVLIFPQGDHNGAFSQMEAAIYILWDNLTKLGYSLRIFESASRGEVIRALINANNRYGDKNKISFAILGGHGTSNNMRFRESEFTSSGEIKRTDFVGRKDLENRRAKQLKDIFVDHPSVVLVACSTGAQSGLGESISRLGAFVSAPEQDSTLELIKPYLDENGKIRFEVRYGESPTAVHFKGTKQPTPHKNYDLNFKE